MFTGIVQACVPLKEISIAKGIHTVRITLPFRWKLTLGQSIAVNGICSTVTEVKGRSFVVEYMPETLRKTTVKTWKVGMNVNLERSLTYGDPVDGHFLPGHIDTRATVSSIEKDGASKLVTITVPKTFSSKVKRHGWIAINGVSLTVARKTGLKATVALVPYTLSLTNLKELKSGDEVNIETERTAPAPRARVAKYASRTRSR